ncbi:MAG: hypothetical protein IT459_20925, partial [Planctomycetes bacterium]|nr:hypothetical protein [Planctomycetota bacterium]
MSTHGAAAQTTSAPLEVGKVSARFVRMIPRDFARMHLLVSQGEEDGMERLAVAPTTGVAAIWNVGVRLGAPTAITRVEGAEIARVIDLAYGAAAGAQSGSAHSDSSEQTNEPASAADVDVLIQAADRDLLSAQGKGPVVKLVDLLLFEALMRKASDV